VAHQRYDWVKKISKNFTNLKILDLGSGNCYLSFHLLKKGNYITSVSFDNANNEKAYCRSKQLDYKNHKIIYKDINHDLNINNGNNLFDKVLLLETIEHIEDDLKLLININKLLLPNGELIISTPYKNFNSLLKSDYYLNIGPGSHVRHGYSITEIEAKLNKAGFEIVKYGYLTSNLANYTSQILRFLSLKNLNFISITFKFIFFIPIKFLSKYNMKKGNYISLIAKKK
jgi:2-polyprenyl-3-methyl-5-hydroxy-6-metoxy-1,4-benzoquinol methylase